MAVLNRSALLVFAVLAASACRSGAAQWGPFRGQIVDADTGAPISGAHIVVSWERDHPNPVHWTQSFYDAQEAVTDVDGRFEISPERRLFTVFVSAPRFAAFAPGYAAEAEEVIPRGGQPYVDATILKMRRLKTREEQCQHEPYGVGSLFPKSEVPIFSAAVDEYVVQLRCGR